MLSLKVTEESQWRKARLIAYEVARKGAKYPPTIDTWMPIGDETNINERTEDELDEIWNIYGKRN